MPKFTAVYSVNLQSQTSEITMIEINMYQRRIQHLIANSENTIRVHGIEDYSLKKSVKYSEI